MNSKVILIFCIIKATYAQWSITVNEFQSCVGAFGFGIPSSNIANAFISQAQNNGGITSKLEAFMAIAQLSWESAGFTARSEWACSGGRWSAWPCDSYSTEGCPPGNKYYGRGFIQLTHCYNYKAASVDFPGIVENPDLVANDDRIAMGTALWYWKNRVHNYAGVQQGQFGSTTRAINGGLECSPSGDTSKGRNRWIKFNDCLRAAGASGLNPKEDGCYDVVSPNNPTTSPSNPTTNCHNNNGDPRYDSWCAANCANGFCPESYCKCD